MTHLRVRAAHIPLHKLSFYFFRARSKRFDVVLIDESSQVPHFIALLGMLRARKWALIGDHNQLLPIFRAVKDKELLRRLSRFCSRALACPDIGVKWF